MGGERQSSKGGRHIGGFLQLFDWNAKSRKRLFSSKCDLPEQPKQGKRSEGNFPTTQVRMLDEEESVYGAVPSMKGSSDYSYASSITDEDGYGTKLPGVVARLMGLDSLPTSNMAEPYSSPIFDTQSFKDVSFRRDAFGFYEDHQDLRASHVLDKVERPSRRLSESKPQKIYNKPIEKFQTETLPPRSAKSIPITHHKLLSPIKGPGFTPSKDVAHIMEAAAKIIESGPQASSRSKISSGLSTSAPLKVRELREKLEVAQIPNRCAEASQRPTESNAAKYLKGQSMNKSWNGLVDTTSFRNPSRVDDSSASSKNSGKSVSLAIQAKVNVQRREGLNSSGRSLEKLKDKEEAKSTKSTQSFKSQSNSHKVIHRKSSPYNASPVLRQNNQKQNCSSEKEKLSSKSAAPNLHGRKTVNGESSYERQRISSRSSRSGSRKSSLEARDGDKGFSDSEVGNIPRKKRSLNGNLQLQKNQAVDNMIGKNEMPGQSSNVDDRHLTMIENSRKKGMDVVSFTFTAPMTRSLPSSESSRQPGERSSIVTSENRHKKLLLSSDVTFWSSPECNVIGGDSLSVLLEQKLRELTSGFENSNHNFVEEGTTASVEQNVVSAGRESTIGRSDGNIYPAVATAIPELSKSKYIFQGPEEMDDYSSNKSEATQLYDCRVPSPVSILDNVVLTGSCNSAESMASNSTEESKQYSSSVQGQQAIGLDPLKKFLTVDTETDLSDSACSTITGPQLGSKGIARFRGTDPTQSMEWELEYVKEVLCDVELMFKDYASGQTGQVINPHLYEQMERRKGGLQKGEDGIRLKRKVLFDCVSECLDFRCQRLVCGGCRTLAKGMAMVSRKERLAEEVCREIQGWRSMGNSMVDELVDKDMSSQYGRWLDYGADEFAIGVEIERQILDSLVVEVVADILPFSYDVLLCM